MMDSSFKVTNFPSNVNLAFIVSATIDPQAQMMYMVASSNRSVSNPQYKVYTINLATGLFVSTSGVLSSECTGFPQYVAYDGTNLVGLIEYSSSKGGCFYPK